MNQYTCSHILQRALHLMWTDGLELYTDAAGHQTIKRRMPLPMFLRIPVGMNDHFLP